MIEYLSEYFCNKPFEFLEVNEEGNVFCCCPGWLPRSIGNLKQNTVEEIWNSDFAIDIRASIIDGSFKYCDKNECPLIGNHSLPHRRSISNPYILKVMKGRVTVLDTMPKIIELSYDRTCNLSCPSCRTSSIIIDNKEYIEKIELQERLLKSVLEHAELLIITGSGDPFASRLYRTLLESFDFQNYPKLKIHLMTNGQLLTPKMWERIQNSHKLIKSIQISIDAASKETYCRLRPGGDFHHLLSNLEFIQSLKKSGFIEFVSIDFVVQNLNYREMESFVELGKFFEFDRVGFSSIRNWGTFSADIFSIRAVHTKIHPEYQKFLEIIRKSVFRDPIVDLGNLSYLQN